MSGGSAYINSGGPNKIITLPNTKITFTIPLTQYQLNPDLSNLKLGVVPNIEVVDAPSRIINGTDGYLEQLIQILKQ